jgi:hypothetical protein
LRIVLGKEHHCGDAPHARSKLRARRARPCRSRGADERNEVAPLRRLSQGLRLREFSVLLGPSKQEMTVNEIAANRQFALHNPERQSFGWVGCWRQSRRAGRNKAENLQP